MENYKSMRINLSSSTISSRQAFSPRMWLSIFFLLYFIVPMLISLILTREIFGFGALGFAGWEDGFLGAALLCFLSFSIAFLSSYLVPSLITMKKSIGRGISPVTKVQIQTGWVMFFLGLGPTIVLGNQFDGNTRSALVGSLEGQIIFGLSYSLILGYICLALAYIQKKKLLLLAAISIVFVGVLFVLGGRGRVAWPIISLFVTYQILVSKELRTIRLICFLVLAFFLISLMDPILDLYYGKASGANVPIFDIETIFSQVFITRRNFDSFYNFYVIYFYDSIPHSLDYLIYGAREAFMGTYFPQILSSGYSFPATVPGTFWMVGGFWGLVFGSVGFGLFVGILHRLYVSTRSSLWIAFLIYFFVLTLNLGSPLFDNAGKLSALAALLIPFWLVPRIALALSRETQTKVTLALKS